MKFTLIASALAFTGSALAVPSSQGNGVTKPLLPGGIVTPSYAKQVVGDIISIFGHAANANATATALLADDFAEFSDSILALQGRPLTGTAQTADKAEWIQGILGEPPTVDIDTLYVSPAGPRSIIWEWQFNKVAAATYRVRGFNRIVLNQKGQICELYLEFNSIAWGLDDGELKCNVTA